MNGNSDKIWASPCFEQSLTRILNSRQKTVLPRLDFTVAAVLFPIYYKDGAPTVLLTRRSNHVEHHKGEISFPGGKMDDTDPDLLSCALRETAEEVGIRPEDVRILGELDDFYTVATSYLVVPFVGVLPYPYEFKPSAREIDEVLSVPLEIFFDPSRRSEETWHYRDMDIEVVFYKWQGHNIWGATARILKHFTELIEDGRSEFSVCASEGASDGTR
jgi:8-oxo-dGTP pyrophosphatase MutT (NUDIX family)